MVWIMGSMYLMDINLDVMSISITALTIGLGITYGIHYTHRFLEDLQKHKDVHKALRESSEHTGMALLGAAATTIAGFGMLYFSLLPPLQNFGALVALTIFYSFFATVVILPSLLAIWGKLLGKRGTLADEEDEKEV
jgi:predicted RND superfamily exporter protein